MTNATRAATLAEFLLARIAEDGEGAQEALDLSAGIGETREWRWVRIYGRGSHAFYKGCPDPAHVLAECASKQAIVEEYDRTTGHLAAAIGLRDACKHLASVYSDHPDYREEWRP